MPRGKRKDQKVGKVTVSTPASDAALYNSFLDENGNDTWGIFQGLPTYLWYFLTRDPDEIAPERNFIWNTTPEELAAFPALNGSPRVVVRCEDHRPTKGFRFFVMVPEGVPAPDWDVLDARRLELRKQAEEQRVRDKKKTKKELREEFLKMTKLVPEMIETQEKTSEDASMPDVAQTSP